MTRSYRFISEHRAVFGVARLCRVLDVRRQGFYEWLAAAPARAERAAADERLAGEIAEVHAGHRGAYGRPRIVVTLRRRGRRVNHKRVGRIMRERGITGITRRRRRSVTLPDQAAAAVPDLIGRDFTAAAPGQRLVGDITYLPTQEGWLYLATVIDLHNREVVGHAMAGHMRAELVCDAITLAARRGLLGQDAIFHSDRGSQFRSRKFVRALARHGLSGSMGRVGAAGDNAAMESFFALLQNNVLDRRTWTTRAELRIAIVTWIERTYHRHRRQPALGRLTPIEYEAIMTTPASQAACRRDVMCGRGCCFQ